LKEIKESILRIS